MPVAQFLIAQKTLRQVRACMGQIALPEPDLAEMTRPQRDTHPVAHFAGHLDARVKTYCCRLKIALVERHQAK